MFLAYKYFCVTTCLAHAFGIGFYKVHQFESFNFSGTQKKIKIQTINVKTSV